MAVTVGYVNPGYVWGILFLLAILALIIWIGCGEHRRRCSSKPACSDKCDKKRSRRCKDSGCFNWFSWGNRSGGLRKFNKGAFYSCNFWVFVVLTILTRYNCWALILAAIVWVILIEIARCCSRWFRRQLCRVRWYYILLLNVFGIVIGAILLGFSCAFPPATYCYGVASSMAYNVDYSKTPMDGVNVVTPAKTGFF